MVTKQMFKQMRDWLQLGIYKVINPVVKLMIKVGITPNVVTTIGFLGNLAAAVLLVYGAHNTISPENGLCYIGWAGGVIILFSLFDMLDGQVARLGGMTSTFGALYDSVLDRYSELFTLGGICYYMLETGYVTGSIVTFVALVGSMMVSYVRARAEGLGIECKVGFMQRPERVVVTSVAALATGIVGCCADSLDFDPMWILVIAMAVIAVFANLTAFARLAHCRRELNKNAGK